MIDDILVVTAAFGVTTTVPIPYEVVLKIEDEGKISEPSVEIVGNPKSSILKLHFVEKKLSIITIFELFQ